MSMARLWQEASHLRVGGPRPRVTGGSGFFLLCNSVHFIFFHADSSFQFFSPFRCNFCLLIIRF